MKHAHAQLIAEVQHQQFRDFKRLMAELKVDKGQLKEEHYEEFVRILNKKNNDALPKPHSDVSSSPQDRHFDKERPALLLFGARDTGAGEGAGWMLSDQSFQTFGSDDSGRSDRADH